MAKKSKTKQPSFFGTDLGRIILGVIAFLAITYLNKNDEVVENATSKMNLISNQQTETSLDVKYILTRLGSLENITSKYIDRPIHTREDSEAMLLPINSDIQEIKKEQRERDMRILVLEQDMAKLKYKQSIQ